MPLLQHQPRSEPVEQRAAYRYPFVWPVSEDDPVLGSLATGASMSGHYTHGRAPSRIDLLELDIDGRLVELWCEAIEVEEWTLEVAAAFMRAAYGKGYSDALTEPNYGSLCHDHGYAAPERRAA